MKKLKRILIIFLIIISISMFIKNILLAVYTDGYMKIYNNTSSYLDCSDTTTQGYIGDNIGIPTGIPGNNDYKYIIAVEPRAWCTADKQVDTSDLGTGDCKIVAIIDIGKPNDPVNTTIFDPNGTKKNAATSVSKKNRAQSAFTMYAGTEKSITAVAQKHFIQRFKDYSQHIKRFSVSMYSDNTNLSKNINGKNYTYATYSDAINNLNYEDAGVIDKKGIVENSDTAIYSYNSTNFKTKISNLDIDISSASSLVSSRTIKINGTSYNMKLESSVWYLYTGTTKKGVYDKSKGIIYMNDKIDVTSFELTVKYKYIHGRVYLLGTNYSQQRAVSLGKEVEGQYTQTVNIDTSLLNVDVSMQKYIIKVNTDNVSDNRSGWYTREGDGATATKPVKSGEITLDTAIANNKIKYNNPIQIKLDDSVTYRIEIYNNDTNAKEVYVIDRLSNNVNTDRNKITIKKNGTTTMTINSKTTNMTSSSPRDQWFYVAESGSATKNLLKCKTQIAGNSSVYFDITLKFDQKELSSEEIDTNTAWINVTNNRTIYRTADRDYISMKTDYYAIGLQKYVSKVERKDESGTYKEIKDGNIKGDYYYESQYDFNKDGNVDQFDVVYSLMAANGRISKENSTKIYENIEKTGEPMTSTLALKLSQETQINAKGRLNENSNGTRSRRSGTSYILDLYDSEYEEFFESNDPTIDSFWSENYTTNNQFKKSKNPVKVEADDKVTFKIELINEGARKIKVKEIIDQITADDGVDLASEKISISNGATGTRNDNIIKFNGTSGMEIGPGEIVNVNLTYTVNVTNTGSCLNIKNMAMVQHIYNEYDQEVNDHTRIYNNIDADFLKTTKYKVSLEKYVSQVNDTALNTDVNSSLYNANQADRSGHPLYDKREYDKSSEANKVKVEPGDEVTFTLKVTNTGTDEEDKDGKGDVYGSIKSLKITETPDSKLIYKDCSGDGTYNASTKTITLNKALEAGQSANVQLTFKVNVTGNATETEQTLSNTAEVTQISNPNSVVVKDSDGAGNNKDSDYLKTKIYQVNLEKYVSQVNGAALNTDANSSLYNASEADRSGKAEHKYDDNASTNDYTKRDNPVKVEPGDDVTFTLKITNTGTDGKVYGSIKSLKITETPDSKLTYDSCSGDGTYNASTKTITLNKALEAGKSAEVQLTFKVNVTGNATRTEQTLSNTAEVTDIINRNDVAVKDSDGIGNNKDSDYLKTKIYKVGLEKYVSKVNGTALNTDVNSSLYNAKEADRSGKAEHKYDDNASTNDYTKRDNPVKVEPGDKVTFALKVTNTGTDGKVYGSIKSLKITEAPDSKLTYESCSGDGTYNASTNKITLNKALEAGKSAEVQLTFKVNVTGNATRTEQTLSNTAEVTDITNRNDVAVKDSDGIGNNKDSDYLKTKIYKVGLEKFVSKVNGNDLNTDANSSLYNAKEADRSGKAEHKYDDNASTNDYTKRDNPVKVEPGDKVTFTIKVTNTGTDGKVYGTIKGATITESPDSKLTYDSCSGDGTYNASTNKITLNKALEAGKSAEVQLTFKVNVTGNATRTEQTLSNTAEVTDITNRNDVAVKDSDGIGNNKDSDYLKTKIYKVGLEKFVSKVNGNDLNTDANSSLYNAKEADRSGKAEHKYDDNASTNDYTKRDNPVRVEPGDKVTFTIKVTNTGTDGKVCGTIKEAKVTESFDSKLVYESCSGDGTYDESTKTITLNKAIDLNQSAEVKLTFKVNVTGEDTKTEQTLSNTAEVTDITNRNDVDVKDTDGQGNNKDTDYLKTKLYEVSLEKYVSKVVDKDGNDVTASAFTNNLSNRKGYAEHKYDNDSGTKDYTKENNIVTVVKGDKVTYTIELKNDAKNTAVYITQITDYLPDGVKYGNVTYDDGEYNKQTNNAQTFDRMGGTLLEPGQSTTINVTVEIIESNMSLNILKNVAKIDTLKNRNDIPVKDSTDNNNIDADYLQLNYKHEGDPDEGFFKGKVWNDRALDKTGSKYNGKYDSTEESYLEGIKVYLYRATDNKGIIATTKTNSNGEYVFGDENLADNTSLEEYEKYIKGPKASDTDRRWAGYYSYYIIFEYDGITYTSTPDGKTCANILNVADYTIDSNASEDRGKASPTREQFNKRFEIIDNSGAHGSEGTIGLSYNTKNENGYIPQSLYEHDNAKMNMQSSTNKIELSETITDQNLLEFKYIDLGLRGRDLFDLELTSDVHQTEVTVNNVTGVYNYSNKVTVRDNDITGKNAKEDMAYTYDEILEDERGNRKTYVEEEDQNLRNGDLNVSATDADIVAYNENQGLQSIYVTYKITVINASESHGTASKIIDYYDNKYKLAGAYNEDGSNASIDSYSDNVTGKDYGYVIINTNKKELSQSEPMTYYVKLELKNAKSKLQRIVGNDDIIPTYNMAEIYEYKTIAKGDEATRGLIDKDSEPGSISKELVRTTDNQSDDVKEKEYKSDTTLEYYFKKENLSKLKYEDDTYATPTLYFSTAYNPRTIKGTVFEDYTEVNTDRKRSGDGIKTDDEPGINGATVELLEKVDESTYNSVTETANKYKKADNEYYIVRYRKTTEGSGKYEFKGFLPGNYIIRYYYGDKDQTFYITSPNSKSYNGEDFQATNNKYDVEGITVNKLNETPDFWYAHNEENGVSTATDDVTRRKTVSNNVCGFSDSKMQVLNNVRDGMNKSEFDDDSIPDDIKGKTSMFAKTENMKFTVEETTKDREKDEFDAYEITNMNFGIAEVPVTTIDLQKHVNNFTIKDSTGENILANAVIDMNNTKVTVNPSKIGDEPTRKRVQNALKEVCADTNKRNTSTAGSADTENVVTTTATATEIQKLRSRMTQYSLGKGEITITYTWETKGNVLVGEKSSRSVLDVSIEDEKLQGAKLEVTYDVSVNLYAEKNFDTNNDLYPTIDGMIDYIDNDLTYNAEMNIGNGWSVVEADSIRFSNGASLTDKEKYTTIVDAQTRNQMLLQNLGTGTSQVTLERVLSSTDSTIGDIITSSIDTYEYENSVRITKLNYDNMKITDDEGNEYELKDRVRTLDRYIVLPGVGHDDASSEIIAIHPPTGDSGPSMNLYIITAIGLAILAIGAFGIMKFVVKGKQA